MVSEKLRKEKGGRTIQIDPTHGRSYFSLPKGASAGGEECEVDDGSRVRTKEEVICCRVLGGEWIWV